MGKKIINKKGVYLDYAGSAPIDEKVLKEIALINKGNFANPSAIHKMGVLANRIIEESRQKVANLLGAHADEIIFTGSGTESVALALLGLITNYKLLITNEEKIPHIITTNIEHPAVIENCKMLEIKKLAEVTYVPVEANGIVDPKKIRDALKENTVLVTVMYANNEIGTIQPIREIAKEIRHFKKNKCSKEYSFSGACELDGVNTFPIPGMKEAPIPGMGNFPFFHTDACQAMNYLDTENMDRLGVDLLSFNSSKIYGPKGIGVLYKRRGINLSPIYQGGGQEFGLRSGTENVSSVMGVAMALEKVNKIKNKEIVRLSKIRDYGIKKLLKLEDNFGFKIKLNGDPINRLPNNINISIKGIKSELLVIELDALGIYVSEKSACHSEEEGVSHVIKAIREASDEKINKEEGSLRISLGRQTKKEDINYLIVSLTNILKKYKNWT